MGSLARRSTSMRARDQRGFGFAQLLVIMPIILIIMGSAASYFYEKLLTNIQIRARANFKIHQQNMMTDLENPMVWDEILRVNSGLRCMEDSSCTTLEKRELTVVGVDGKYLSGSGSLGFELDGTPCKKPESNEEPRECPIKWKFVWRPMCASVSACPADSEIEFYGELEESGLIHSRLNLDRYKIVLYRKLF